MTDIWLIIRAPAKDNQPPFYFLSHGRNFTKYESSPGFIILGYHREGRESAKAIVDGLNEEIKKTHALKRVVEIHTKESD